MSGSHLRPGSARSCATHLAHLLPAAICKSSPISLLDQSARYYLTLSLSLSLALSVNFFHRLSRKLREGSDFSTCSDSRDKSALLTLMQHLLEEVSHKKLYRWLCIDGFGMIARAKRTHVLLWKKRKRFQGCVPICNLDQYLSSYRISASVCYLLLRWYKIRVNIRLNSRPFKMFLFYLKNLTSADQNVARRFF